MLQLLILAATMGVDNLSVAVGIGLQGVSRRQLIGIPLLFTFFQTALPAVGLLLGTYVGAHVGKVAAYVGFALLIALGIYTALMGEEEGPRERRAAGFIVAALAVSLDSLAVGFTLSFVPVPPSLVIGSLGLSALVMTLMGLLFGHRIGRRAGGLAEVLAGVVLALTGVGMLLKEFLS